MADRETKKTRTGDVVRVGQLTVVSANGYASTSPHWVAGQQQQAQLKYMKANSRRFQNSAERCREAVRQVDHYAELLRDELGVGPSHLMIDPRESLASTAG